MSQLSRMLSQARPARRRPQGGLRNPSPVSLSLSDSWWKEHFYDVFGHVGYDIAERFGSIWWVMKMVRY